MIARRYPAVLGLCLFVGSSVLAGTATRSDTYRESQSPSDFACAQCHARQERSGHPIGVSAPETPGLPLGKAGEIVCETCHEAPTSPLRHGLEGTGGGLRKPAPELCLSCHDRPSELSGSLAHALLLGRAHAGSEASAPAARWGMDSETRTCLHCHDGSAASSPGVREAPAEGFRTVSARTLGADHPIGVDYSAVAFRGGRPQLHPPASLPEAIRLPDGKVGCGSCHSPYSREADMLVMDPRRGRLCLSCHIK